MEKVPNVPPLSIAWQNRIHHPFPLFDLNDTNLGKILRKVDSKSFSRLQQTSWEMWGFVQKNSEVSVFTEGIFLLRAPRETDTSDSFRISYRKNIQRDIMKIRDTDIGEANVKGLYACRLAVLKIVEVNSQLFQALCDFVKKYRITCDELFLHGMKWQPEQYAKLLEILKPVSVNQGKGTLTLFEALYSYPISLKNVTVTVHFDSAETAAKKFLATCQNLVIVVSEAWDEGAREISEQLQLFKIILQLLFSKARPHLKQFTFVLSIEPLELPSVERLAEELSSFDLKEANGMPEEVHAHFNLPLEHYPEGSLCELTLKRSRLRPVGSELECGKIYFKRG